LQALTAIPGKPSASLFMYRMKMLADVAAAFRLGKA
jgi:hypothetical protein